MNRYFYLLLCSFLAFSAATAQTAEERARQDLDYYSDKDERSPRSERFSDNLWFGGGAQLAFQSNSFENIFVIGLSPMVGYKVTEAFSIGPRFSANYNAYRQRTSGNDFKSKFVTWSAGAFARMKAFQQFFAHAEYSLESDVIGFNASSGDPIRRNRSVPYLGAGYTSGFGGLSSEVLLLFRLNQDSQFIQDAPFIIRFGFNYNF